VSFKHSDSSLLSKEEPKNDKKPEKTPASKKAAPKTEKAPASKKAAPKTKTTTAAKTKKTQVPVIEHGYGTRGSKNTS